MFDFSLERKESEKKHGSLQNTRGGLGLMLIIYSQDQKALLLYGLENPILGFRSCAKAANSEGADHPKIDGLGCYI